MFDLEKEFDELMHSHSLFKNEHYLRYFYPSEEVVGRDNELRKLFLLYSNLLIHPNSSINVLVQGASGVGKTTVIKHFFKDFTKIAKQHNIDIKYLYFNCRMTSTYQILIKIARLFNKAFPERGLRREEIIEFISKEIHKNKASVIIILDEANNIIKKEKEFLYYLTRITENFGFKQEKLSIVGIVKSEKGLLRIMPNIVNYFQKNLIVFNTYSANELFDILKDKANRAFNTDIISNAMISYAIELLDGNLDVRAAMHLLYKAGKFAEQGKASTIKMIHLQRANISLFPYQYISFEFLKKMNIHQLLFLYSFTILLEKNKIEYASVKKIMNEYESQCVKRNFNPLSYSTIWNYLHIFEEESILKVRVVSENIKGRKARLSLKNISLEQLQPHLINSINNQEAILYGSK